MLPLDLYVFLCVILTVLNDFCRFYAKRMRQKRQCDIKHKVLYIAKNAPAAIATGAFFNVHFINNFYFKPKISSAETSSISHKFANVSSDGYLSRRTYLLIVDGLIPNLSAISFCVIWLDLISSLNLFCISFNSIILKV